MPAGWLFQMALILRPIESPHGSPAELKNGRLSEGSLPFWGCYYTFRCFYFALFLCCVAFH